MSTIHGNKIQNYIGLPRVRLHSSIIVFYLIIKRSFIFAFCSRLSSSVQNQYSYWYRTKDIWAGSIDYFEKKLREIKDRAVSHLEILPESEVKQSLSDLVKSLKCYPGFTTFLYASMLFAPTTLTSWDTIKDYMEVLT